MVQFVCVSIRERLRNSGSLIYLLLLQNKIERIRKNKNKKDEENYFTLVLRIETVVDLKVTSALSKKLTIRVCNKIYKKKFLTLLTLLPLT